jgi:hypothetical protein
MPKKETKYTTEKYWFVLFPILLFAVVGIWLSLVLFYPYTTDLARSAVAATPNPLQ